MSTLTCLAVAMLLAQGHAHKYHFRPVGSPLETVCSETSETWFELDKQCAKQFPGYRLLQRGYRERLREVRAQDLRGLIPLRVKRVDDIVYWVNDFGVDDEEVGGEFLLDMEDNGLYKPIQGNEPSIQDNRSSIKNNGPSFQGNGSSIQNNVPGIQGNGPSIEGNGPRIQDHGYGIKYKEPSIQGNGPFIQGNEPGLPDNGPSIQSNGPITQDDGVIIRDNEPRIQDIGPTWQIVRPSLQEIEPSLQNNVLNMQDTRPSRQNVGPNIQDVAPSMQYIEPNIKGEIPNGQYFGPNIQNFRSDMQEFLPSTPGVKPSMQDVGSSMQYTRPSRQDAGHSVQYVSPSMQHVRPNMQYVRPSMQYISPSMQCLRPSVPDVIPPMQEVESSVQYIRPNMQDAWQSLQDVGSSIQDVRPNRPMQGVGSSMQYLRPSIQDVTVRPSVQDAGPNLQDVGPSNQDVRTSMNDIGSSVQYVRPNMQDVWSSTQYVRPSRQDIGSSTQYVRPSRQEIGSSMEYVRPSRQDIGSSMEDFRPSMQDEVEPSSQQVWLSIQDNEPSLREVDDEENEYSRQHGRLVTPQLRAQVRRSATDVVGDDESSRQHGRLVAPQLRAQVRRSATDVVGDESSRQHGRLVAPQLRAQVQRSATNVVRDDESSRQHGRLVAPQLRAQVRRSAADVETVGALDLASMQWHLVDEDYQFASLSRHRRQEAVCAICEMMSRADIRPPVFGAQSSADSANIYRLTVRSLEQPEMSRRESTPPVDRRVMQALAEELGVSVFDIDIGSSPVKRDGKQLQFLILLSPTNMKALLNKRMIQQRFQVTKVDNLSACRAENTTHPPIGWPETDAGNVAVKGSSGKIFASRECIQTTDGVEWSNPVMWQASVHDDAIEPWLKPWEPNLAEILHKDADKDDLSYKSEDLHGEPSSFFGDKNIYKDDLNYKSRDLQGEPSSFFGDKNIYKDNINYKSGDVHGETSGFANENKTNATTPEAHYEGEPKPRTIRETAEFLHSLASIPVKSRYLDVVAEELNKILQLDRENISTLGNYPTRLAQDLERIVTHMILESGRNTMTVVKSNVALLVADVHNTDNPISGVTLSINGGHDPKVSLREIHDYNVRDLEYSKGVEVSTVVPQSLISSSRRVAFTIFSDDKLFQGNKSKLAVLQSRIINIAVDGNPNFPLADGEFVEISFKSDNTSLDKKCVFWNFAAKEWSMEGCTLLTSNRRDVCRCNHLTHFALLITPPSYHHKHCRHDSLQAISIICCLISLVGLLSINLTLMVFNKWQREFDSLIVINLSSAMALNISLFLVTTFLDLRHRHTVCVLLGVLLHYSVLACFCWMLVIASLQVFCLFNDKGVVGSAFTFCKAFLFAWGLPLIPVCSLLVFEPSAYKYQSDRQFCYPHGKAFYETVLGPVAVIMTLNAIAFTIVVCNIYECCCWKSIYKPKYVIEEVAAIRRVKTTVFLFFLFGLPWSFGFFAHKNLSFAYLFCLTATLQGFVLCAFIVIIEGSARHKWKRLLFGK